MSTLTLLFLIAIAGWLVWRYYLTPAQRARFQPRQRPPQQPRRREPPPAAPRQRERETNRTLEVTTLEQDPKTGVYRPVDRAK